MWTVGHAESTSAGEMEIIGKGFVARHLAVIADRHADAVVLAAGVSSASETSAVDFAREAELLCATARRCRVDGRLLLFLSTASPSMYGLVCVGQEDQPVTPANPYGAHKLALEHRLRESGADFLVLRMTNLVGPGQPAHQLLPTLTRLVRAGRVVIHKGATRDLIDIEDAVRIIDLLLLRKVRQETVNVASGSAVAVEAIIEQVESCLGMVAEREYHEGGSAHLVNIDKLRLLAPETARFGFGPSYYRAVVDTFVRWELSHA